MILNKRIISRILLVFLLGVASSYVLSQENFTMQDGDGLYENIAYLVLENSTNVSDLEEYVEVDNYVFEISDSFINLSQNGSEVIFYGLNLSDVEEVFLGWSGLDTEIIAVNDVIIDGALAKLKANETVDFIAYCDNFDFFEKSCQSWIPSNLAFSQMDGYVIFIADHFSAYAGMENRTNVSEVVNSSEKGNSSLSIWDSGDIRKIYPGNLSIFYANYTNGSAIDGICKFASNFSQGTMKFDPMKRLFNYSYTFSAPGIYSYNIYCNSSDFKEQSALGNVFVSKINKTSTNTTVNTSIDKDKDGFGPPIDCNDDNALVNPSRQEILYNSIDDDCNSMTFDYVNVEVITDKQKYAPNQVAGVTIAAPKGADTYLTIDSPTNMSYVYVYNNYTYPVNLQFPYTATAGIYLVEAITSYKEYTVTKNVQFQVESTLTGSIICDDQYYAGRDIQFNSFSSGGIGTITYLWDFGDGTTSTLPNPIHKFNAAKTYKIVLIVKDSTASQVLLTKQVKIQNDFFVKVRVTEQNSSPIEDARVRFDGDSDYTNASGYAEFHLTNKTYNLRVNEEGYKSIEKDVKINGSTTLTYKLEPDNDAPPLITLISPLDDQTLYSVQSLSFKVVDDGKVNCTLYLSEGDGWWSEESKLNSLSSNVEYQFSVDLGQGDHFWKLECIDETSDKVLSPARKFTINSAQPAASGGSTVNQTAVKQEQVNDTYSVVSEVMDLIPTFDTYSPDQRKVIGLLKLEERMDELRKELERTNSDLFNLRYRSDAVDVLQERDRLLGVLENIKNSIPIVLTIEKDSEFVKYVKDDDARKVIEEYVELRDLRLSGKEKEKFVEANILLQKKVSVNTAAYNVHLEYMSGRKEDITVISKKLDFEVTSKDLKIVEYIPKEIITSSGEIKFLFDGYQILKDDPVFEIQQDVKDYSYYVERKISLEIIPQIHTLVLAGDDAGEESMSSITGFAIKDKFSVSNKNKTVFFIELLVIAVLASIFVYNNLRYNKVPVEPNANSKIALIEQMLVEIRNLMDTGKLHDAGLKYSELKMIYREIPGGQGDQLFETISKTCADINMLYVANLIDTAFEKVANGDSIIEIYSEIENEYKNLDQQSQDKIYSKCCELASLINNER